MAVAHVKKGVNKAFIARMLKVSRGSVNKWVVFFLDWGLSGMKDKPHLGRPPKLTQIECKKIATFIDENSRSFKEGRLIFSDIQRYIEDDFAVKYRPSNNYHLLHEFCFSLSTSRSKHPKQPQEAQDEFKKTPN